MSVLVSLKSCTSLKKVLCFLEAKLIFVLSTVSAERWLRESASLRRLLNETIEALDSGKAQRRRIDDLQRALSSANTGTSMKLRQQRRDAVITLLRIRRDAGFQGQPELEYRWNSIDLLALVEMTKEELEGSKEAGADMLFSVEDEGMLIFIPFLLSSKNL